MLGPFITGVVTGEAAIAAKRAKAAVGAYAIAGVLILVGVVFLLAAAFIATAERIGPLRAALALGAGFLVVGVLFVLLFRAGAAKRARRDAERRAREATAIASATSAALLPALLASRHSLTLFGIAGAAAAGYAIFRENQPRRTVHARRHDPKPGVPESDVPPFIRRR